VQVLVLVQAIVDMCKMWTPEEASLPVLVPGTGPGTSLVLVLVLVLLMITQFITAKKTGTLVTTHQSHHSPLADRE
jgi:hypothetical protein